MNLSDLAALFQQAQQQPVPPPQGLGSLYGPQSEQWGNGAVMADQYSPSEQFRDHQRMLELRGQTFTPTLNPGRTWGELDKNAIMPNDVMSNPSRWAVDNI